MEPKNLIKKPLISKPKKKRSGFFSFLCCQPAGRYSDDESNTNSVIRPSSTLDSSNSHYKSTLSSLTDSKQSRINAGNSARGKSRSKYGKIKPAYPVDEVFILGTKDKIVAKITKVKVLKPSTKNSSYAKSKQNPLKPDAKTNSPVKWTESIKEALEYKKEIFSQYEKGIKAEQWEEITPEPIAKHIAERLACDIMIDALCGYGGNTIQFAKYCNFVIAIDVDASRTYYAKHNAQVYQVGEKIDFLTSDFLKLKLSGDVVFLSPNVVERKQNEKFSLYKHLQPDLRMLIAKSLEISHCISIKLPADTDLEDMAEFFNSSLEYYELYSKRFCIEIEKIFNSEDEVECVVVYFGDCSSITADQEYQAIYDYLAKNEPPEWKLNNTFSFVCRIIEKVGIRKSFKFLSELEDTSSTDSKLPIKSLFDSFLEKLINENIFTEDGIEKIRDIESKRRATWGKMSPGHSFPSSLTAAFRPSPLTKELKDNEKKEADNEDKPNTLIKKKSYDSSSGSPFEFGKKEGKRLYLKEDDSSPNASVSGKTLRRTTQNTPFGGTIKNSYEVSELAVSSYSVESGYLDEDPLEEGLDTTSGNNKEMRRSTSDTNLFGLEGRSHRNNSSVLSITLKAKERDVNQLISEISSIENKMVTRARRLKRLSTNNTTSSDETTPVNRKNKIFRSVNPISEEAYTTIPNKDKKSFKLEYEGDEF